MKKKSHDYIKSFNKTTGFDKQSSKLENTLADDMNASMEKLGHMEKIHKKSGNLKLLTNNYIK